MELKFYILDGHNAVEVTDVVEWGHWIAAAHKEGKHIVKAQFVSADVQVSTIFRGLDDSFGQCHPGLFETMVFGGEWDYYIQRYATWKQAETGHQEVVEMVKKRCHTEK